MRIEKLDKDNIEEYINDLHLDKSEGLIDNINKLNEFGVKKDDKFIFGFLNLPEDDFICIYFGNNNINSSLVKECVDFLDNSLSFNNHLIICATNEKVMNIMDELYKVKQVFVTKKTNNGINSSTTREKYADIDMKSIKYIMSKNGIICNLYNQNIQSEDVIGKLDEFFMECNASDIEFIILPDSFEILKSLGYECKCKTYIINSVF